MVVVEDGGHPPDAGPITLDAGPTTPDAGPTTLDAGPTTLDAGPTTRDAGPTTLDAGPSTPDGGPALLDGGLTTQDAGELDGGAACTSSTEPYPLPDAGSWCLGCTCFPEPLSEDLHFKALWVAPEGDVWLATYDGYVLRHRAGGFEYIPTPEGSIDHNIGIDGTSADDVWLAGGLGSVLHWDGEEMSQVFLDVELKYHEVHVLASDDVWVQGYTTGEGLVGVYQHFDGAEWTTHSSGPATLTFHVLSSGDIWGVDNVVHRYTDGGWTTALAEEDRSFRTSHAVSEEEVWVGGYAPVGDPPAAALLRWDGSSWIDESDLLDSERIADIWSAPSGDLWVVGVLGTTYRRTGGGWTKLHDTEPPISSDVLFDTASEPMIAGNQSGDLWVAGPEGRVRRYVDGGWQPLP